ncbi:MAG: LptA/OstA family protein [Pseudomonadota bacterium]|nr:LptA/OstA family protein [Pseudomonadota bacterium]
MSLISISINLAFASTSNNNSFVIANEAPYELISDNMFLDRNSSVIGFSGNVSINQGPFFMSADQIELFFVERFNQKGFKELKATGQIVIENRGIISATGNFATYSVNDKKMILTGNVTLTNQLSMIKGNKLILDISTGKIEILNDEENQEKVKGILVEKNLEEIDN